MSTIAWMFLILSFGTGFYIGYRITRWYYKRKIIKLNDLVIIQERKLNQTK